MQKAGLKALINAAKNLLLDVLFPVYCLGCRREGEFLCYDCRATYDVSPLRYCLCQNPVPVFKEDKCSKCLSKKLDGLYCALNYQDPRVRRLIHVFKYEPCVRGLAEPLADFVLSHLELLKMHEGESAAEPFGSSVLIAVPLHRQKQRSRGYNQSAELAKELASRLGLRLLDGCLVKIKKTSPQVELSLRQRKENVRGAFVVHSPAKIKGRQIILVDDVYTTGSTMEECAGVLKWAGAGQVRGLTAARG